MGPLVSHLEDFFDLGSGFTPSPGFTLLIYGRLHERFDVHPVESPATFNLECWQFSGPCEFVHRRLSNTKKFCDISDRHYALSAHAVTPAGSMTRMTASPFPRCSEIRIVANPSGRTDSTETKANLSGRIFWLTSFLCETSATVPLLCLAEYHPRKSLTVSGTRVFLRLGFNLMPPQHITCGRHVDNLNEASDSRKALRVKEKEKTIFFSL